jgi:hypothetical protein
MKNVRQKPVKKIKFSDAIKRVNPFDREEFQQQYGHMKKIPEFILREWL